MKRLSRFMGFGLALMCGFGTVYSASGNNCEIVKEALYRRAQDVIVTDWKDGVPYNKYTTENYRCADITCRNNFWQALYSTDINVTAVLIDKSTMSKKLGCEKKLLEPGDTYTCSVCFETDTAISALSCSFR